MLNRPDYHLPVALVIYYLLSPAQVACANVVVSIQTRKPRLVKGSGVGFIFREETDFIYLQVRIREECSRFRPSRMCSTNYHAVPLI